MTILKTMEPNLVGFIVCIAILLGLPCVALVMRWCGWFRDPYFPDAPCTMFPDKLARKEVSELRKELDDLKRELEEMKRKEIV